MPSVILLTVSVLVGILLVASAPVTPLTYAKFQGGRGGSSRSMDIETSSTRVINGQPVTDKNEYPFIVDLSTNNVAISSTRFCTGTLIDSDVILTAAHCVLNDGYQTPVYATIGRIELSDDHKDNEKAETFRAIASIVHPKYQGIGSPNDAAVMLLDGKSHAPKVQLAIKSPTENEKAWVVGYGVQKLGTAAGTAQSVEVLSGRLQKTVLKVKAPMFCSKPESGLLTPVGMICTAGVKEGSSACHGDSGGGLFSNHSLVSRRKQIGIVSYGDSHCASEDSGVFTDISSVREWIKTSAKKLQEAFRPVEIKMSDTSPKKIVREDRARRPKGLAVKGELLRAVKFFKILTQFANKQELVASLCGSSSAHDTHLILSNSKHEELRRDYGSCPNNKMSRLSFNTHNGTYIIAVSRSKEGPFRLSISSRTI